MFLVSLSIATTFDSDSGLNALVEDQDVFATIRLNINGFDPTSGPTFTPSPAPPGGLRVYIDSDIPNLLDRFDLSSFSSDPQFSNIDVSSFTPNADHSGFAVTINEGATVGALNLRLLDNVEPDPNLPGPLDGLVNATFTLRAQQEVPADDDQITGISDYIPDPFATVNTLFLADNASQLPSVGPSEPLDPAPTIEVGISVSTDFDHDVDTLVEDQSTTATVRFDLSEPAPAGGLRIYVETGVSQSLDRLNLFDILLNPRLENIDVATFITDFDDSGFALTIDEGATFGTFLVDIADNVESDIPFAILDGLRETTLTLQTSNDVSVENENFVVGVSDYAIDPDAASNVVLFADTASQVLASSTDSMIDFETASSTPLVAGTTITDQFEGVSVSTPDTPHGAMIFDSANPTGGDSDLFAPELGNVLIISEDGDRADPDDNATGGTLRFDWDDLVGIASVGVLDIEETGSRIQLYDDNDSLLQSIDIPALGNNSIQDIAIGVADVARMDVIFSGSGALTNIALVDTTASGLDTGFNI